MENLKKEIKRIQNKIDLENEIINEERLLLKSQVKDSTSIKWAMFLGFGVAYLLTRKKTPVEVVRLIIFSTPFWLYKVCKSANLILSLMPLARFFGKKIHYNPQM